MIPTEKYDFGKSTFYSMNLYIGDSEKVEPHNLCIVISWISNWRAEQYNFALQCNEFLIGLVISDLIMVSCDKIMIMNNVICKNISF